MIYLPIEQLESLGTTSLPRSRLKNVPAGIYYLTAMQWSTNNMELCTDLKRSRYINNENKTGKGQE